MILKSFGCSFIFGTDLADAGTQFVNPPPSQNTWPAHLARHFGLEYKCFARPGSGNLQIAERVLSHLSESEPCVYVIGWTWIDRFDYTNSTVTSDPMLAQWHNWNTLMPTDTSDLSRTYYQGLHSEYRDKLTTLMHVKLVIDTLIQRKQQFIMTYMDELMFDQRWNYTSAVLDLQESIKSYMIQFEKQTFLNYSLHHGFKISSTLHPLEQAHKSAAQEVIQQVDAQKILEFNTRKLK